MVGIFPNLNKENVRNALPAVVKAAEHAKIKVAFPLEIAEEFGVPGYDQEDPASLSRLDFAMTLGGDGTILRAARYVTPLQVPLIGVNMGKVGFLTEACFPDLEKVLKKLAGGAYTIEKRSMLQLSIWEAGKIIKKGHALNDMVLESADRSRLTRLRMRIAGQPSANFPSDGIIIASATGSTAYSLSAGGPVVHPSLSVMLITPICPHALHARPLVIPMKDTIEIEPYPPFEEILVSADGMTIASLEKTQKVIVERCPFDAKFARLSPLRYYETWQDRLLRNEGQTIV